jgi:hypothetical protein
LSPQSGPKQTLGRHHAGITAKEPPGRARRWPTLVPRRRGEAKPLHDFGFDRGGEKPILAIGKAADFGELLEQFGVFLAHGIEFAAQVRQVVKLLFGERTQFIPLDSQTFAFGAAVVHSVENTRFVMRRNSVMMTLPLPPRAPNAARKIN